ncbi:hypothetical protein SIID45300_02415 [Candidatus Magnetaquicoccaceae bacterium FCR-1]|uniref:GapR-like DNA-binding domain-containing protein n=1 Tax=Candidatus Magnetaquiglobus chichijimensis TaxID=3141448 RepID=A0ABQ0CB30_9PROT
MNAAQKLKAVTNPDPLNANSDDDLRRYIERIERLEEEKSGIAADIRAVYLEAKAQGFDTKTMRKMIRLRAMQPYAIEDEDALNDLYRSKLGLNFGK